MATTLVSTGQKVLVAKGQEIQRATLAQIPSGSFVGQLLLDSTDPDNQVLRVWDGTFWQRVARPELIYLCGSTTLVTLTGSGVEQTYYASPTFSIPQTSGLMIRWKMQLVNSSGTPMKLYLNGVAQCSIAALGNDSRYPHKVATFQAKIFPYTHAGILEYGINMPATPAEGPRVITATGTTITSFKITATPGSSVTMNCGPVSAYVICGPSI